MICLIDSIYNMHGIILKNVSNQSLQEMQYYIGPIYMITIMSVINQVYSQIIKISSHKNDADQKFH